MSKLEVAKYYAERAKSVYASTSYDNLGDVTKCEAYVIEYSGCTLVSDRSDALFTAYYVGLIDIDKLIDGLTEHAHIA